MTHDETTIIAGALELSEKTASDAMTPIAETFAIDINAKLDRFIMISALEQNSHFLLTIYLMFQFATLTYANHTGI